MKVRANVTGSELRCGRGMKFISSVRELEDGLGMSYTMVMEGGPVDREGVRKKKFNVFHLRPKGETRQVCLVVKPSSSRGLRHYLLDSTWGVSTAQGDICASPVFI